MEIIINTGIGTVRFDSMNEAIEYIKLTISAFEEAEIVLTWKK